MYALLRLSCRWFSKVFSKLQDCNTLLLGWRLHIQGLQEDRWLWEVQNLTLGWCVQITMAAQSIVCQAMPVNRPAPSKAAPAQTGPLARPAGFSQVYLTAAHRPNHPHLHPTN